MAAPDELCRQEAELERCIEELVYERALRSLERVEPRSLRDFLA